MGDDRSSSDNWYGFSDDPCATAQIPMHEPCEKIEEVKYVPSEEDTYIEEEGSWFEEQGAKCFLQSTPPRSVAAHGHLHDALELILIKRGKFTAHINEERYEARSGDLLFFRSGDVHRIYTCDESENSYYVMKIHPSLVFDVADKKLGASYMLRFTIDADGTKRVWRASELVGTRVAENIVKLADECRERRPYFDIAVKELSAAVLLFLLRNTEERGGDRSDTVSAADNAAIEQIYRAITYMNSNYRRDISASEVARSVGMSYSHFSRSFGVITGRGFKAYLNAIRQRRAEELLLTSEKSVADVSSECGYSNPSYFIMSFKRSKGITPHAYRMKMKK